MKNWKTYKLGEITEIIGGGTPSTAVNEYWNGKIPWLTPRDLTGYKYRYISKGERCITDCGLKNSSARLLPKGSILLTSRAPIGYLVISENEVCTNQGFKSFIVNKSKLNNLFLYYLLKTNIENIKSLGTGTTFAEVSASTLRNMEFTIPESVEEQHQIASILSSLDDKIELNIQMNQTLEATAQEIFKEWFVKFNYPGFDGKLLNELPIDWRKVKLNEVLEIKYGRDHKHLEEGLIPVYGSGGIMRYANKALYNNDSILIPRKGTLSNLFYLNKPFWSVDTMFYTIFKNEFVGKYLFYLLKTMDLASMNVGSAVPSLTTEVLNKLEVMVPSDKILKEFEVVISSFFLKIEKNNEQNKTLSQLRDNLLPKLMTGKIEVN